MTLGQRFYTNVNEYGPYPQKQSYKEHPEIKGTHCHIWMAYKDKDGYGIFCIDGKRVRAHVFIYDLIHGGHKHCVLHKCDNSGCVNGLHLFDGTVAENNKDMTVKGRHGSNVHTNYMPAGEPHWNSKLSRKDVLYIQHHYRQGRNQYNKGNAIKLANKFNISRWTVMDIVRNRSWQRSIR